MGKRKREGGEGEARNGGDGEPVSKHVSSEADAGMSTFIQIITGSYERVLHGMTAKISLGSQDKCISPSVHFSDTFLFHAHASAIRCLALSPISATPSSAQSPSILLASGGTDERLNLYSLSATPPAENEKMPMPSLGGNKISENPRNRDLGSLMHHSSSITALHFPMRSKILSAAEDNTVAVARTKDLSVVSTIKAPRPKVQGRPSGDTAAYGATPAGINDFAVHSSMKLMLTVGKGERCMRLWNLVTAKKAGVLNFARETLQSVQEGKYSSGEGRKIDWHPRGEEFAVAFERGIVVFGANSRPKCRILPQPLTKLHQMRYLTLPSKDQEQDLVVLAVSTENGKILFYSTSSLVENDPVDAPTAATLCDGVCLAQLDGSSKGNSGGRIKDFEILPIQSSVSTSSTLQLAVAVTAGSDGRLRIWTVSTNKLILRQEEASRSGAPAPAPTLKPQAAASLGVAAVGDLIGTYETGSRITCVKAFVMVRREVNGEMEGGGLSELEGLTEDANTSSGYSDSSAQDNS